MDTSALQPTSGARPVLAVDTEAGIRGHVHGVCWAAVAAGALAAASLSLIMLILGVGLGLSSVSPWSGEGVSAGTFGVSTIVWLTVTQLGASGLGGYLAGRLRARWSDSVHTDEVYFRDTAHGFLAWSLATLVTAAMLTTAVGAILSGGAKTGAAVIGTATAAGAIASPTAVTAAGSSSGAEYFVDAMFRKDAMTAQPAASAASGPAVAQPSGTSDGVAAGDGRGRASSGEALRIFANASSSGSLSPEDTRYLGQQVAQRTGLAQAEAEKRVTDAFNRMQAQISAAKNEAQAATDTARKASAYASLWMFISLLIGAFVASAAATIGGRHRDQP